MLILGIKLKNGVCYAHYFGCFGNHCDYFGSF